MTGFKLHCPPGFVDRAYLVFLWLLTVLTELPIAMGLSRSHPPFGFGLSVPASWPATSPGAPLAPDCRRIRQSLARGAARAATGAAMGMRDRRADRPMLKPHPPGGACPSIHDRRPCGPAPVSVRYPQAGRMPPALARLGSPGPGAQSVPGQSLVRLGGQTSAGLSRAPRDTCYPVG
jgi:hypothetical protein